MRGSILEQGSAGGICACFARLSPLESIVLFPARTPHHSGGTAQPG